MLDILQVNYGDPRHGEDLIYLLDCYARDPMGGGKPLSPAIKNNLIPQLAQRPYALSLLGYYQDKPAGLINAFESFSSFKCRPLINIHDVIVAPEFRGYGISQAMLATLESIARERGCCKLTLEVLEGNTLAQVAYRKFGFAGYELDPAMGKALFWEKAL